MPCIGQRKISRDLGRCCCKQFCAQFPLDCESGDDSAVLPQPGRQGLNLETAECSNKIGRSKFGAQQPEAGSCPDPRDPITSTDLCPPGQLQPRYLFSDSTKKGLQSPRPGCLERGRRGQQFRFTVKKAGKGEMGFTSLSLGEIDDAALAGFVPGQSSLPASFLSRAACFSLDSSEQLPCSKPSVLPALCWDAAPHLIRHRCRISCNCPCFDVHSLLPEGYSITCSKLVPSIWLLIPRIREAGASTDGAWPGVPRGSVHQQLMPSSLSTAPEPPLSGSWLQAAVSPEGQGLSRDLLWLWVFLDLHSRTLLACRSHLLPLNPGRISML